MLGERQVSGWPALTRYVERGHLVTDTKFPESLLRGIAVSRKNFLLVDSDRAGKRDAVICTQIETAKPNGVADDLGRKPVATVRIWAGFRRSGHRPSM